MIAKRGNSPKPDLIALDIGNTRIALAGIVDQEVVSPTDVPIGDVDRAVVEVRQLWQRLGRGRQPAVVIASVVPEVLAKLGPAIESAIDRRPLVIQKDIPLPMECAVKSPQAIGADRICAAAAAFDRLGQACTVVDFGTAVTIDCVSDEGVFLGGAILPGLELSARSLTQHTALLPEVDIVEPANAIGRDTAEAIQSGVFFGLIGAVRELTERYATKLGRWPYLVATGGAAETVAPACGFIDSVVPYLSLMGIGVAYRRYLEQHSEQ